MADLKRRNLAALAPLAAVVAAAGFFAGGHPTSARRPTAHLVLVRSPGPRSTISARVSRSRHRAPTPQQLTPQELAGQRIIYAYAGLKPPASLLASIRAGQAGGVIFFANNIASPGQLRNVVGELQRASLASPIHRPLLTLVDQEGGEVRRLPGPPSQSEKQVAASAHPRAAARAAGTAAGENLRGAGVNVNLAPVLDVYRRPGNFIDQFQRSYSSNPRTVTGLGPAFITAQQRVGVAATAKHFPGLGAAAQSQNTDLRPVTLRASPKTLRAIDELPYPSAIAAGVKLIMTSWAIYPALDSHRPAGLSSKVIQGELRRRLGFRGITITDGIDAGAVTPFGSLSRRVVLAASAGADLILCAAKYPNSNTPAIGITARRALTSAITHHVLGLAAARAAAGRILALRSAP